MENSHRNVRICPHSSTFVHIRGHFQTQARQTDATGGVRVIPIHNVKERLERKKNIIAKGGDVKGGKRIVGQFGDVRFTPHSGPNGRSAFMFAYDPKRIFVEGIGSVNCSLYLLSHLGRGGH